MPEGYAGLRATVEAMLAIVDASVCRIDGTERRFDVGLGTTNVAFDMRSGSAEASLERLANAIEARIAYQHAQDMLAAAGMHEDRLPLWLVTGSSVLAAWLAWSRTETVFRRRLALTDLPGIAPVVGTLDRPMRRNIGQTAAKIRVRSGLATAERIELPGRLRCFMTIARESHIVIEDSPVPETMVLALAHDPTHNDFRSARDVVDHPFVAAADPKLTGIRNESGTVVIDIASRWGPLAPVPEAAWRVVPPDADLSCPWQATPREVAMLYDLVDTGRRHCRRG